MVFGSGEAEQAVFRYSFTSMSRGIGFFLGSVLLLFLILPDFIKRPINSDSFKEALRKALGE